MNGDFFPPEIICHIFQFLNGQSFLNCKRVCKKWKAIADYLTQNTEVWKRYCQADFRNEYQSLYNKSAIPWWNIYRNLRLWPQTNHNMESQRSIFDVESPLGKILKLHFIKDGIIIVLLEDCIKFYDAVNLLQAREPIIGKYLDYIENEFFVGLYDVHQKLQLITKNRTSGDNLLLENIDMVKLDGDYCYYIERKKELYKCRLDGHQFETHFLAKWYGVDNINRLNICDSVVYVHTESGKILVHGPNRNFELVWNFNFVNECSSDIFYFIRNHRTLFSGGSNVYFRSEDGRTIIDNFPSVTAFLLHGNIIIFGTRWGQILMYEANSVFKNLSVRTTKCLIRCSLSGRMPNPITCIDVHERVDGHSVIIGTRQNVYILDYDHNKTYSIKEKEAEDRYFFDD